LCLFFIFEVIKWSVQEGMSSSVSEHLSNICQVLGSIPATQK
jgi:hypothetical protein